MGSTPPWPTVSALAHELREPLSTILLWEQILRASNDPAILGQALDAIRDAARAQDRVIARLAEVGRLP
jgi:signal transduction histidine kinase